VADVDELDGPPRRPGHEHVPTACDAVRPVREAPRRVVRADDQPGAHGGGAARESRVDLALAERLERAVVGRDVLRARSGGLSERGTLVDDLGEGGVDGDARDEDVVPDGVGEQAGALADDAGEVARGVDDGVPLAPAEALEAAVAVPDDPFELRIQAGTGRPPVEERHLVATREGNVDHRAPDELRATEQQQPHSSSETPASSRSTSSAVL